MIYRVFLVLLLWVELISIFSDDGSKYQQEFFAAIVGEGIINLGYIDKIYMYE